jgi:hypothetical protein
MPFEISCILHPTHAKSLSLSLSLSLCVSSPNQLF